MKYWILAIGAIFASERRPVKLFIEERTVGNSHRPRNITLEMTRELMKKCPQYVAVTENEAAAEVRLAIAPGATTLYRADGSAEHVFGTKYMVSRLGKEVCAYLEARAAH